MDFLDLPQEIIQAILEEAILTRGITRGLRLRLVSKLFSTEVIRALFSTRLLDEILPVQAGRGVPRYCQMFRPDVIRATGSQPLPFFTASYVEYRVLNEPPGGNPQLHLIRNVANELSDGYDQFRAVLKSLCGVLKDNKKLRGVNIMSPIGIIFTPNISEFAHEGDLFSNHLYVAACHLNSTAVMRSLIRQGMYRNVDSSIFGTALEAGQSNGSNEVLDLIISGDTGEIDQYMRESALTEAVQAGRIDTIRYLYHLGTDKAPRESNKTKDTILIGEYESPELLMTPSREVSEYIFQLMGATDGEDSIRSKAATWDLGRYAKIGQSEMVSHMLSIGAHPDGFKAHCNESLGDTRGSQWDPRHLTPKPGRWRRYQPNSLHDQPIIYACEGGFVDIVRKLLERGAKTVGTLEIAAGTGNDELVRLLLDHGADTAATVPSAAGGGFMGAVRMLLDHGADPNETSRSPHPLVSAIALEHESMFRLLMDRGAKLTASVRDECVHCATVGGLESMLRLLEEYNVCVD